MYAVGQRHRPRSREIAGICHFLLVCVNSERVSKGCEFDTFDWRARIDDVLVTGDFPNDVIPRTAVRSFVNLYRFPRLFSTRDWLRTTALRPLQSTSLDRIAENYFFVAFLHARAFPFDFSMSDDDKPFACQFSGCTQVRGRPLAFEK